MTTVRDAAVRELVVQDAPHLSRPGEPSEAALPVREDLEDGIPASGAEVEVPGDQDDGVEMRAVFRVALFPREATGAYSFEPMLPCAYRVVAGGGGGLEVLLLAPWVEDEDGTDGPAPLE